MAQPPTGYRKAAPSVASSITPRAPLPEDRGNGVETSYPLGAWAGEKFVFKSPEAEKQWQKDSFLQGSHHLLWMKGRRLRPEENTLAGMGLPSSDDTYLGPDGQHYQTTPASREDPHMAMLRAAHLAREPAQGSATEMGQRASLKALPQAMTMMAQGARVEAQPPAANDNRAAANENQPPAPAKSYPGIGRFPPASTATLQSPDADEGGIHERSKAVATRLQVERFAPTNFAALAKEVEKYETDNPFFTRVGQRLKAGALDMDAASAANVGAAALARAQLLAPYLDRIDRGENFGSVTTDPSDIAAHNSSDPNQPGPAPSPLTQYDIGLLSDYYAATPEERQAQRKRMVGASAEMLGDAAASRAASAAIARHPAVQAVARAIGEKRYRDAAEILKTYPLGIMGQVGVEGLPSALPGLAASLVNPILGAAVFAGSDAANAYGGALLSSLEAQGVDTTDPLAIQKALSDPNMRETAEKYASKWAMGSAAVGLATGGVGGKVVSGAGKAIEEAADAVGAKLAKAGIKKAGTETEFVASELAAKNAGRNRRDWDSEIFEAQRYPHTESGIRKMKGDARGVVFIDERPIDNETARKFQEEASGAVFHIDTEHQLVPGLAYKNPNERGVHVVKFDSYEISSDGNTLVLKDQKTKLVFNEGSFGELRRRFDRIRAALDQNSGVKVLYEFPDEKTKDAAAKFIQQSGFSDIISVRVRQ